MATYGNEVSSVGGHTKTQACGTVHAFRSTVQNLPLRTYKKLNTEIIAAEMNIVFCVSFLYFSGPIAVGLSTKHIYIYFHQFHDLFYGESHCFAILRFLFLFSRGEGGEGKK